MNDNPLVSNVKRIKRLLGWVGRAISNKNSKNFTCGTFYDYKYYEINMKSVEDKNQTIDYYILNIKCEDNRELNIKLDFDKNNRILNINITYRIDDNSKLIISKKLFNVMFLASKLKDLEYVYLKDSLVSDTTPDSIKYPLIRKYKTVYLNADDHNEQYKRKLEILEKVKFTDDALNHITDIFRDTIKELNNEYVIYDETKRKISDAEQFVNTLTPSQEYALRLVLNRRYQQNRNK